MPTGERKVAIKRHLSTAGERMVVVRQPDGLGLGACLRYDSCDIFVEGVAKVTCLEAAPGTLVRFAVRVLWWWMWSSLFGLRIWLQWRAWRVLYGRRLRGPS